MSLLAKACGQLQKDNEKFKEENKMVILMCNELKAENDKLRQNYEEIKEKNDELAMVCNELKQQHLGHFLPMKIADEDIAHFYTRMEGHLMSVKLESSVFCGSNESHQMIQVDIYAAVHTGEYDSFQPKPPLKISALVECGQQKREIDLLKETDNFDQKLPYDVLYNDLSIEGIKHRFAIFLDDKGTSLLANSKVSQVTAEIFAKWEVS